jgi:predicted GIY-YIG superfamily endonuclease
MKWFYIIKTSHNDTLGFGITTHLAKRLVDGYCNPSAAKQEFALLYYGENLHINQLEKYVKRYYFKQRLNFTNTRTRKLEWIDPIHKVSMQDLVDVVEDRITGFPLPIKRIRKKFLPFTIEKSSIFDTMSDNSDLFLEQVKLDKKRKKV